MLTTTEISEKVRSALAEELKVRVEELQSEKRFAEDLGADSIQRIELVMKLEEAFGIKIPADDALVLVTVQDAINYIQKHLSDGSKE
ncbi:MAG: acyl carrier protein [Elusimicrobia bacterium]|nr:acyl carrier protein [Elusimicrobiota bacterium]